MALVWMGFSICEAQEACVALCINTGQWSVLAGPLPLSVGPVHCQPLYLVA
jgi:hypothetical protein